MDFEFDNEFNKAPLNESKLYQHLLDKIMVTQLAGSSTPRSARVTVKGGSTNPDLFRLFIIPSEEIGEMKSGRSYYSQSVPALMREHFEDEEAQDRILPHLAKFFEDAKNGDLELFEESKYKQDSAAFFKAVE